MSIDVLAPDRIPMSQKERDVLKIMHAVLRGEVPIGCRAGGSAPRPPEFNALPADASGGEESPRPGAGRGPSGIQPTVGRLGRTPAAPYPPGGEVEDSGTGGQRPAEDHPWRKPFKRKNGQTHDSGDFYCRQNADISIVA